jgi:hypothetical protein
MPRLVVACLTAISLGACSGGGGPSGKVTVGSPQLLYTDEIYSYGIPLQLDATSVYFAVGQSTIRQVMSVPKAGGTATRLLPKTEAEIGTFSYQPSFALHAGTIYACRNGELDAVPAVGGDVTLLAALPIDGKVCLSIAATDDAVYVLRTDGALYGVPAGGGAAIRLDDADDNNVIVTDGQAAYYVGAWSGPSSACPSAIFVGLRRVSLAAPTPVEIACLDEAGFQSPSLAGGLLSTVSAHTEVEAFALAPFDSLRTVTNQAATFSVITDGQDVIWSRWAEDGSGTIPRQPASIQKVAASGGMPALLMSGGVHPASLTLDDGFVYFIDTVAIDGGSSYAIERIAR